MCVRCSLLGDDLLMKKQFCYILARQGINFELHDDMVEDDEDRELPHVIINNVKLSEGYLTLARDIEVMEPKCLKDVYKTHLLDGRTISGANVDSARHNLTATFVNAFVNVSFGKVWFAKLKSMKANELRCFLSVNTFPLHDRLMTDPTDFSSDGSSGNWLLKNKEHTKMNVVASLKWGGCEAIVDALISRSVSELGQPLSRLLILSLGLIYLGKQGSAVLGIAIAAMAEEAAVISLGLIGAGTNIACIVGMLRNLSSFYSKGPGLLFCVRITQGLVHMGNGLLTLNPYHSDRLFLLSFVITKTALAGLVTILHACLDMKYIILGKYHFVLYYLVLATKVCPLLAHPRGIRYFDRKYRENSHFFFTTTPGAYNRKLL
ncbi:hypothetical protein J1N35_010164 [Gossypium stocksii]|uniref:RPN1 N-terminal domain-containing protein n=1 Tax=Gossypium stocksii TaxID=47602 RepID=A0A9D4ACI1_9ROSI|nr:hypothetical protein J1N35_010164 [Gossypium stocksii]